MPHWRVKHTRSETLKAKGLVLNRSSVQGTLVVESKETLNQIKKQTNKRIKTTTTTKQKTTTNKRESKEAFKVVVQLSLKQVMDNFKLSGGLFHCFCKIKLWLHNYD